MRRISVRDFKVGAGKVRHGAGTQVRQAPCACQHPSSCALIPWARFRCLPPSGLHTQPHKCWSEEQAAPGATVALSQLHPSRGRGTRPHCSPSPATARRCSRSGRAGPGLTCPALHQKRYLCSSSAAEQPGLGGHSWHLPGQSPHTKGTRGKSHQLERQPQRREELSPDNQRRLFSYCAVS